MKLSIYGFRGIMLISSGIATVTSLRSGSPDSMAANGIDALDRRLVAALQPDGRRAFADIASELGVSEGTIRQRYRRLVSAGILQVVGVADPFKIGYGTMTMIGVKVAIDSDTSIDAVGAEIAQFPEVSYAVMSTGAYDLLVEVIALDNEEFTRFLTERLHRVRGVSATEAFMLLRVYKMNLGGWRSVPLLENEPISQEGSHMRREELNAE